MVFDRRLDTGDTIPSDGSFYFQTHYGMATMTDPIAVIRAALVEMTRNVHPDFVKQKMAIEALAALDQVEGRVLPELPPNWRLIELINFRPTFKVRLDHIYQPNDKGTLVAPVYGEGSTPNAACIAAKAKIEGGGG